MQAVHEVTSDFAHPPNANHMLCLLANSNASHSWDLIQSWHQRHLDSLRFSGSSNKSNGKGDAPSRPGDKDDDSAFGVPTSFMKQSKLCIKFQSGLCDLEPGHVVRGGRVELVHNCAHCLHKNKVAAQHSAKECTEILKVFHKGGGHGSSST